MTQAYEEDLRCRSGVAAADLSAKQFYGVKIDSAGLIALASAAGEAIYGVLQDKPTSGKTCSVAVSGITKAKAGGVIAPGALVKVHSDGTFLTASAAVTDTQAGSATDALIGSHVVGIARNTANTASGDLFPLELMPMGAVPTTAA